MKELEQIQTGQLALDNNGTLDELWAALNICFPKDFYNQRTNGGSNYYEANGSNTGLWAAFSNTELPSIKVTDFLSKYYNYNWQPREGEWVEVSDNGFDWKKRIYLHTFKNKEYPVCVVAHNGCAVDYLSGKDYSLVYYKHVRQVKDPVIKITVDGKEISKDEFLKRYS